MNETEALAQFIVDTRYERLPGDVVEAAKVAILDGVANVLAGSTQELADIIGEYTRLLGGTPDCSVVGWDSRPTHQRRPLPTGCSGTPWTTKYRGSRQPTDIFLPAFGAGVGGGAPRFGTDHY